MLTPVGPGQTKSTLAHRAPSGRPYRPAALGRRGRRHRARRLEPPRLPDSEYTTSYGLDPTGITRSANLWTLRSPPRPEGVPTGGVQHVQGYDPLDLEVGDLPGV